MSVLWSLFLLVCGGALLYFGGSGLVRGSASLATRLGVSQLVIGLTVVAFGTSAPELFVSTTAALKGSTDISLGNIIGSNIANIALVLAIAMIIRPMLVQQSTVKREIPFVVGASVVLWIMCLDGRVGRLDGIILLILFVSFLFYCFRTRHPLTEEAEGIEVLRSPWMDAVLVVAGLAGLVAGSELFVRGATVLARLVGVSEFFIGLSVVAVGTSLPELATSAVAAARGHADISVGNVVGSNLFNILLVQGAVSTITPIPVPSRLSLWLDLPVMTALPVLLLVLILLPPRHSLVRHEGLLLLAIYAAFIITGAVVGTFFPATGEAAGWTELLRGFAPAVNF
jgi:cation:H+ antiporter